MTYIDSCILAVPTDQKDAYLEWATGMANLFREYGALEVVEAWGNDIPDGVLTSYPKALQCKPDETVVLSWVVWPSKEAHDKGTPPMFDDPRFVSLDDAPFDQHRIITGGFDVILQV